jgi:hypothetical protein
VEPSQSIGADEAGSVRHQRPCSSRVPRRHARLRLAPAASTRARARC